MTAVSSTTLIADARRYADQRQSTFFTDSEVRRIINQQIAEYYDLLVSVRGHEYYATSDEITLSAGTTAYSLPADFYQMLSVDLVWASDDREPIPALNHQQDIHRYLNRDDWARYSGKAYRLRGPQIDFYPTPNAAATVEIHYVPLPTLFEDEGGPADFDFVNGWEKLVTLGAAIEMLEIEEAGTGSRLHSLYDRQYERIKQMAADRDAANEIEVRDVYVRRWRMYPPADGTTQ